MEDAARQLLLACSRRDVAVASIRRDARPRATAAMRIDGPTLRIHAAVHRLRRRRRIPHAKSCQPGVIARVRARLRWASSPTPRHDEHFCKSLVEAIGAGGETETEGGVIQFSSTNAYARSLKKPRAISR
jgi:hypothetical protein